ncbi:class F sortase [Egicoccus halophilus]|uniref:Sortase family protein n=1 Tax=Egicoccus halophilus TaxID=1670830 RepID=A0A8J3EWH2_9ACTN|nr:class F sortase [Egicoccus halophilus]GGI03655.1 hypothetical protein GCM10011354_05120 [Egicoccus halophilus]
MTQGQRSRGSRLCAAGLLGLVALVFGVTAVAWEDAPTGPDASEDPAHRQDGVIFSPDAPGPSDDLASGARDPERRDAGADHRPLTLPVQVTVPSVSIDAEIEPVGADDDRRLVVPPPELAGWFEGRAVPGQRGPAVLVGHVDSREGPAVFHGLDRVEAGDRIEVTDESVTRVAFEVERVQVVPKDDFPTGDVYDAVDRAELRLITCGGPFDRDAGSYRDNVIVFAVALDEASADDAR